MPANKEKTVTISVKMTESQAMATAQFYKRIGHDHYHQLANHYHATELRDMIIAGDKIRDSLNQKGFDPR